jgi:ribosomal protein L11 methyltransferase
MGYRACHITVVPPQPGSEILTAVLGDLGFESFEYKPDGFTGYITDELARTVNLEALTYPDFRFSYRWEIMPEKNWNEEWEKNFEPVRVEDLLYIRAPFHPHSSESRMEIVITPKMSFGTGHHQTTRLVCRAMFGINLKGRKVLDVGTGTGILAIVAMKLGAASARAIDIDAWSVENARENCAQNNASVTVTQGDVLSIPQSEKFDVMLANINRNVLASQMNSYGQKTKKDGDLLISGFFVSDAAELRESARAGGFQFLSMSHEEEWACLHFRKQR